MKTFIYDFGNDYSDDEFEFDPYEHDLEAAIDAVVNKREACKEFIKEQYSLLSWFDKEYCYDHYNIDGTTESVDNLTDSEIDDFFSDFVMDDPDYILDLYQSELMDYFYDDAYDAYKESNTDPYTLKGLSRSDFA